jgi:hypothetical protein
VGRIRSGCSLFPCMYASQLGSTVNLWVCWHMERVAVHACLAECTVDCCCLLLLLLLLSLCQSTLYRVS